MRGLTTAVAGALLLGVLSTLYDFIWAMWIPRHRPLYGLVHGMTLLSAVGLVLGWPPRRPIAGLAGGALAGLLAAAGFYALAPAMGMRAMFPAWMLLWLLFAALAAWLEGRRMLSGAVAARGVIAALLSGAAFWLISDIWLDHEPGGPNYLRNLLSWTFAYFPGFAALTIRTRPSPGAAS
ncbi:MAG TPA: hypothetical protein VF136_09140 [Methylomirabilota bacterium]